MTSASQKLWLDREYNTMLPAGGFEKDRIYRERSLAALQGLPDRQTFTYDAASGSALDFYPGRAGGPLFVWIHGGYWRASSKNDNIFVAPGLVAQGINVASVDYSLAPAVTIFEIVRQVRQSVAWLYAQADSLGFDRRRLHIGGHSAGGHLVGMLLVADWLEPLGLPPDLFRIALPISGLFDLEPLRHTLVNAQLQFSDAQIEACSPIRHVPRQSTALLLTTYGGKESSEFARQTDNYLAGWEKSGNRGRAIKMPGYHHFDIILELEQPGNPLFDTLVAEIMRCSP